MISSSIENVYSIFRDNYSIVSGNNIPASIDKYDPHLGFSKIKSSFETEILQLLAANDFIAANTRIQQEKQALFSLGKTYKTYCSTFLQFLDLIIKNKNHRNILSQVVNSYHINGEESLVAALGGERNFIKKALEQSYFFNKDLVDIRFSEIVNLFKTSSPIPARWQGKRKPGRRSQCGYNNCDIDVNGNAKVCSVIKTKTGFTISSGKCSIFQNYKISHIWGQAVDPLYFTNFWNIAFVPFWANDLLDNPTANSGSLSSKMLNTYKAICIEVYNMQNLRWPTINMAQPLIGNPNDVIHGTYTINIINSTTKQYPSPITKIQVKI